MPKAIWQIRGKDGTVCMTKVSAWYFSLPLTPSLPILTNMYTIENIATGGGQWKSYSKVFLILAICTVEYVKLFNCLSWLWNNSRASVSRNEVGAEHIGWENWWCGCLAQEHVWKWRSVSVIFYYNLETWADILVLHETGSCNQSFYINPGSCRRRDGKDIRCKFM